MSIDDELGRLPLATIDEMSHDLGAELPTLAEWPAEFGLLAESRYEQRARSSSPPGVPVHALVTRWRFQPHRGGAHAEVVVSLRLVLDGPDAAGDDSLGPWRAENAYSRPRLLDDAWEAVRRGLRASV